MNVETLDLSAFKKAIDSLERALDEYAKDVNNEFVRDACIQRFEYTYDSATKMIKRHLKLISDDPGAIESVTMQDRIRHAYGLGLLNHSWDIWWQYRDNRAATSHGYNEDKAVSIADNLQPFFEEVTFLYNALSKAYA